MRLSLLSLPLLLLICIVVTIIVADDVIVTIIINKIMEDKIRATEMTFWRRYWKTTWYYWGRTITLVPPYDNTTKRRSQKYGNGNFDIVEKWDCGKDHAEKTNDEKMLLSITWVNGKSTARYACLWSVSGMEKTSQILFLFLTELKNSAWLFFDKGIVYAKQEKLLLFRGSLVYKKNKVVS